METLLGIQLLPMSFLYCFYESVMRAPPALAGPAFAFEFIRRSWCYVTFAVGIFWRRAGILTYLQLLRSVLEPTSFSW